MASGKIFMGLPAAALLLFAAPASAQIEHYELDKPHTQVMFAIDHLGFSVSHGKFLNYEGRIVLNRGEPEKSSLRTTIKTASISMGDNKWDEHMKSPDFFNVEKFPDMTFESTGVKMTGDNTAEVVGNLTILDVTRPVTLAVVHKKSGKHPFQDRWEAGFSATATIKRSDFGMDYGLPMVGDEVKILIEAEAFRPSLSGAGTSNP